MSSLKCLLLIVLAQTYALPVKDTPSQENIFLSEKSNSVPESITNIVINLYGNDALMSIKGLIDVPEEDSDIPQVKADEEQESEKPLYAFFRKFKRDVTHSVIDDFKQTNEDKDSQNKFISDFEENIGAETNKIDPESSETVENSDITKRDTESQIAKPDISEELVDTENRVKRQNQAANFFNSLGDSQLIIGTFQAVARPVSLDALGGATQGIPFISDAVKNMNSLNLPSLSG
ncbi:hypothetical protein JYU34_012264 [Plutella xylostella]|uniref:Uncharacterized protein n=1 Tax=Plutella xylostella TaxID=51655 RepID=A0ABQ7QER7_PLUXY|nr:hypothetical protein JYU34_012264 [Plutella xylostella]